MPGLGGHVNIAFLTLSTTRSHIEAGTMRALAVASNRRLKDFPNIPTTVEKGFCGSKVNLSGVNRNVIMSGCGDDIPVDERREAVKDHTKSVSRRSDGGASGAGV